METNATVSADRRLMVIVNPISGTLRRRGLPDRVRGILTEAGFDVSIEFTRAAGHATELAARAAADGFHGVVAVGGDGTVNEVARSLCGTGTALGIVPTGSGNGLARHLEIPLRPEEAVRVVADNHVTMCDYGTAQGREFFCTFGVGFDAAVSERFARQRRRGLMMYLKSVIDEYLQYKPDMYTLTIGDRVFTEEAILVVAANASQYGNNAIIAPEASVTDGLLDITVVRRGNVLAEAICGFDLLTGHIGKNVLVEMFRCPGAVIERSAPGHAHIDGDPCTMPARIEVLCHPGRLGIFTK